MQFQEMLLHSILQEPKITVTPPTYLKFMCPFTRSDSSHLAKPEQKFTPVLKIEDFVNKSDSEESEKDVEENEGVGMNHGKWSKEEKERFLLGHDRLGNQWTRIAHEYVKTRSRSQTTHYAFNFFKRHKPKQDPGKISPKNPYVANMNHTLLVTK